jgi:hypothetical protein
VGGSGKDEMRAGVQLFFGHESLPKISQYVHYPSRLTTLSWSVGDKLTVPKSFKIARISNFLIEYGWDGRNSWGNSGLEKHEINNEKKYKPQKFSKQN